MNYSPCLELQPAVYGARYSASSSVSQILAESLHVLLSQEPSVAVGTGADDEQFESCTASATTERCFLTRRHVKWGDASQEHAIAPKFTVCTECCPVPNAGCRVMQEPARRAVELRDRLWAGSANLFFGKKNTMDAAHCLHSARHSFPVPRSRPKVASWSSGAWWRCCGPWFGGRER